ncbi:MAG TPA: glyoxalase superfamily protein [Mesorhizobium sp.]
MADRNYRYMKPGITIEEWGREMAVIDPFGNRIRFMEK